MLEDTLHIILLGVMFGAIGLVYGKRKFQKDGFLKKVEKIPGVNVIGAPSFGKGHYIIYLNDGRLCYEFIFDEQNATRKLGKGTWYVWRYISHSEGYIDEPPIKSVHEFNDYIKNERQGARQSFG